MIYYLLARETGRVKIGFTNNIDGRMAQIRTSCPYKLELIKTQEGDRKTESELHERYNYARRHNEWFDYGKVLEIDQEEADMNRRMVAQSLISEFARRDADKPNCVEMMSAAARRWGVSVALCDMNAIFGDFARE